MAGNAVYGPWATQSFQEDVESEAWEAVAAVDIDNDWAKFIWPHVCRSRKWVEPQDIIDRLWNGKGQPAALTYARLCKH
jgi:hypothetical protein